MVSERNTRPSDVDQAPDSATKVFVSYSRQDSAFVDQLTDALQAEDDIHVFRDTSDILPSEEWWSRLAHLIEEADTVVFCLSERSLLSDVCKREVEHAEALNKRIVPVVIERSEVKPPPGLAKLNHLFFDQPDNFEGAMASLLETLRTDIDWIREHTRLGVLALRWESQDRRGDVLLRGLELSRAETWLTTRPRHAPDPTDGHRAFLTEGRRAATRRQRTVLALSLFAAAVAVALSAIAYWQRGVAVGETERAINALRTQSRLVTDLANEQMDGGMYVEGLLLALEVLPDRRSPDSLRNRWPVTPEARLQLASGFTGQWSSAAFIEGFTQPRCANLSGDGGLLVTCSSGAAAIVWDAATGRQKHQLRGHIGNILDAQFTPSGSVITAGQDGTVRLWDLPSGRQALKIAINDSKPFTSTKRVLVDPLGRFVVILADETDTKKTDYRTRIFSLKDGEQLRKLPDLKKSFSDAAISPDGEVVAIRSFDDHLRVWRVRTGRLVLELDMGRNNSGTVDFDPAWKQAQSYRLAVPSARSAKGGLRILTLTYEDENDDFTISNDRLIPVQHGPSTADFSHDGTRLITWTYATRRIQIWDASTGRQISLAYQHQYQSPGRPAFTPDGLGFLTPRTKFGPVIWPTAGRQNFVTFGRGITVYAARLSPDGRYFAIPTLKNTVTIYDVHTGAVVSRPTGHHSFIRSIEFGPRSEKIVTASTDGSVRLWSVETGEQIALWYPAGSNKFHTVGSALLSPDGGSVLAEVEVEPRFRLWDVARRTAIASPPLDGELSVSKRISPYLVGDIRYRYMQFSSDGSLVATVSRAGHASIRDGRTGHVKATLTAHSEPINSISFSPDGRLVLTTSRDGTARLWKSDGAPVHTFRGHSGPVTAGLISPDGQRAATISTDATVRIWDIGTGSMLHVMTGHTKAVDSLDFSRDGQLLVTGSHDTTVRVWAVSEGREVLRLRLDGSTNTRKVEFSRDGRTVIAMAGRDAVMWRKIATTREPLQDTLDRAKREVPRCLSIEQRKLFRLPLAPPRWCITGPGLQSEPDASKWRPKWPFYSATWRNWLIARDRGEDPPLPKD